MKEEQHYPEWLETAVLYQIFPPSFKDTNGDGIGDLPGITEKLDYIRGLGANTLWLSPIFESPFEDAGYDVRDYYRIAPRYGSLADFDALVTAVHERGMRLLLDFVPGHTSDQHPWFQASMAHERNAYSDRYIWTNTTFPTEDVGPGTFVNGRGDRDGNYMTNFFYFQPALNYGYADPKPDCPWQLPVDHPAVLDLKKEMEAILRYWLDRGVDGFRVDMAPTIVKANDPATKPAAVRRFWQELRQWWDRDYPEAALIAEWSDPSAAIDAGFHADFMIHFEKASYMKLCRGENERTILDRHDKSYFDARGEGELQTFFGELLGHLGAIGDRGLISLPTGNHDLPRYSIGRSEAELKAVLTFQLCLPVIPTLYYGDEIGMTAPGDLPSKEGAYRRTQARTAMVWNNTPQAGFSEAAPEDFYLPAFPNARANVEAQEAANHSLLQHLRKLLDLRRQHPALGVRGHFRQLNPPDRPYPVVFLREWAGERFVVAVNALASPAQVELPNEFCIEQPLVGEIECATDRTNTFSLPGFGSAILKMAAAS